MEHLKPQQLSNTDLYAGYIFEREGKRVISRGGAFIVYKIQNQSCHICEIYVHPDLRRTRIAWDMADEVTKIALASGCHVLTACVVPSLNGASESMAAQLAYGFKIQLAQSDCIVLSKEL